VRNKNNNATGVKLN